MDKCELTKSVLEKYVEAETISASSEISSLSNFTDAVSEKLSGDNNLREILIIEPFYGGSHKQLIDFLEVCFNFKSSLKKFTLPDKKWHWRARTSALYFAKTIPKSINYKILLCSSVLNLAEMIALRLDLSKLFKVIYFHENQLIYPVQKTKERDFQYGYNQILSGLVADTLIFNSYYNMNSFLNNIDNFLKLQPDFKVKNLAEELKNKCKVIYFPVEVPFYNNQKGTSLHIIWPHRWEHDKNPQLFFETLFKLKCNNISFKVSVLGKSYSEVPEIFNKAKEILKEEIIQFGELESKENYFTLLRSGHVVVSTAFHEFFGVAMLEAVLSGCFPLACNSLVYPEIYPPDCLYNTPSQLYKKLKNLCEKPYLAEIYLKKASINTQKFSFNAIMHDWINLLSQKSLFCNKHWQFSILSQRATKSCDYSVGDQFKKKACVAQSKYCLKQPFVSIKKDEIEILQKTISDLQKKLRERDEKMNLLYEKFSFLKINKDKMENDLKSKILSLEEQLDISYETLNEYLREIKILTENVLSTTKNTYEALFLQEKVRCSKLMYENVRLHHEIKRLEDAIRRQLIVEKEEKEHQEIFKCLSEPLMRNFSKT